MTVTKSIFSIAALAAFSVSHAATIFSTGFEAPDYVDGSTVSGSNGWESLNGNPTGTIQHNWAQSGSQALQLSKSGDSNYQGISISHPGYGSTTQNPVMQLEWDMMIISGDQPTGFWGVADSYSGLDRIAVGVSAGKKLTLRSAWIGTVETNVPVISQIWNHFRVDLNYLAGGADVYLNNGYVGSYGLLPVASPEHGQIVIFGNNVGSDFAVVDNLNFSGSPVPEPASSMALAVGALALLKRRAKR
jgi:hypothetical protein